MNKKLLSVLLAFVFVLNLALPVLADGTATTTDTVTQETATATTDTQLADPGITPDSAFYFLDRLIEKIVIIFTFSPEDKAQELLEQANERIAEAQAMTDEGKDELAEEAAKEYTATVEAAQVQVIIALNGSKVTDTVYNDVYGTGDNFDKTVATYVYGLGKNKSNVVAVVYGLDISKKHSAGVLLAVLAKSPEKARKGLLNAFKNVMKHQIGEDGTITVVINGETAVLDGSKVTYKKHEKPEVKKQERENKQGEDRDGKVQNKPSKPSKPAKATEHGKKPEMKKGKPFQNNNDDRDDDEEEADD